MSEALVERLRGIYRIPITDGLGAVGSGEEPDNPNEFVRKFETAPIQHEAADRIEALEREVKELREGWTKAHEADAKAFLAANNRAEAAECKVVELEEERDEARVSLGEAEHHLSNLLARIHRDGGHYEADHGAVKAAEDADKIVANLQAAEADKARLSEALRNVRRAIMEADPAVLTDTFWMPDNVYKGGTVVDFIDAELSGSVSGWRDISEELLFWVEGALRCKDWNWDGDQREAAESTVSRAKALLHAAATTGGA